MSTFAAARLALHASPLTLWRGAQLVMAGGVALPAFAPHPALVIAGGACVGATFMVVTMVGMQSAKRFAGARARRYMAAMTAAFATGQLAGPLTVPHMVGPDADFSNVLWLAAAALAAGVCLLPRAKENG